MARELLEVAALAHNVGMVIAHSGHHKHAAYMIRNSEQLVGFSQQEIELIAQVARYHRKSQPSLKHPEFAALDEDEQRTVSILAGILRIAIGLDRRHAGMVKAVGVRTEAGDGGDGDVLVIEPVVPSGADVGVELFAANARVGAARSRPRLSRGDPRARRRRRSQLLLARHGFCRLGASSMTAGGRQNRVG